MSDGYCEWFVPTWDGSRIGDLVAASLTSRTPTP
jgi:hypothetical protein